MGAIDNENATIPALRDGYNITRVNSVLPVVGAGSLDVQLGDFFQLLMPDEDVTLSFVNPEPRIGTFRLLVAHNAVAHTLTFPLAYFEFDVAPSAKVYTILAGTDKRTEFNITFDGTYYSIKPTSFAQANPATAEAIKYAIAL